MGATSSIKIPIRNEIKADDIVFSLCNPFLFEKYREEKITKKTLTRHLFIFKKENLQEFTKSYGTKPDALKKNIIDVMNGDRNCAQLGCFNMETYNEVVNSLKTGGNIGNWQPWEIDIEKPCIGQWGDDSCEINNLCLSITGYGNPIGNGVDYANAIHKSQIMNKIISDIGGRVENVNESNCAITVNGKTIIVNLDC